MLHAVNGSQRIGLDLVTKQQQVLLTTFINQVD